MKVMYVLFARWKGAKCTTKHLMHVLHSYRMSLASLQSNKVSCLCWGLLWHVVVLLTIRFGMNKYFWISELNIFGMYCSHSLHIFSNYIVNTVVCICWIIADCLGAIQVCVGFPARILYDRPTHMEVYHAAHTYLGGWRPSSRTCSLTI